MKNSRIHTLIVCCLVVLSCVANYAYADFIKSSSLSWISSSPVVGGAGVSVLPLAGGAGHPVGLIVFSSSEQLPAQGFHPSSLQTDKSVSCFIRYSPEKRAFTELVIPHGRTFEISGNVSFKVGPSLRVAISTENGTIPYVSIIHESDPRSVLAFLGTDVVVAGRGAVLESYLDAGNRAATEAFEVRQQDLFLQGVRFSESKIGLPNQSTQSNICLSKGVVAASNAQYLEIQKGSLPAAIKRQLQQIQKGEDPGIMQKYTVLNVLSPSVAVALDGYGKPYVISEKEGALEVPLCVGSELPLG